eukprot:1967822-Rhodomonas_salina.2
MCNVQCAMCNVQCAMCDGCASWLCNPLPVPTGCFLNLLSLLLPSLHLAASDVSRKHPQLSRPHFCRGTQVEGKWEAEEKTEGSVSHLQIQYQPANNSEGLLPENEDHDCLEIQGRWHLASSQVDCHLCCEIKDTFICGVFALPGTGIARATIVLGHARY